MPDMSTRFQWENAGWQGWEIFGKIVGVMRQAVQEVMPLSNNLPRTLMHLSVAALAEPS